MDVGGLGWEKGGRGAWGQGKGKGKKGKKGGKGKDGKPKGKGKGEGRIEGECWKCGKMGHTKQQCWAVGGGQANSTKGGRAGGRSRGRGRTRGRGRGRGVHGLEEEQSQQDGAASQSETQEPEQACSYLEMGSLCAAYSAASAGSCQ
eukprot:12237000-Karenia_brevis.AAC.1